MKFTPSNRRSQGSRKKRFLFLTLGIAFVLLFVRIAMPNVSSSCVQTLVKPALGFADIIGIDIGTMVEHIQSKQDLLDENRELKDSIDEYRARMLVFDVLREENKELQRAVGRNDHSKNVIPALILIKPPQSTYDNIIIDVGRAEKITEGDWLFTNEYVYLGRIMQVGATTAQAQLASSPGVETQAVILPAGINLTVSGLGGGAFEAELPIDIEIQQGDKIMTRGSSPSVIAIVEEVSSRPSDSFQSLRALSPVNVSALRWVSVYQMTDLRNVL